MTETGHGTLSAFVWRQVTEPETWRPVGEDEMICGDCRRVVEPPTRCTCGFRDDDPRKAVEMDKRNDVVSCGSKRLDDCDWKVAASSNEDLKKIKEAKNRCQEAGKHAISRKRKGVTQAGTAQETRSGSVEIISVDSKAEQASPQHIRGTTSSPRKVLDQSGVTSSPRKVLDQSGVTSSPRKVLDQSGVTSSPRKVLDQLGATSSPRKVLDQSGVTSSPRKVLDQSGVTSSPRKVLDQSDVTSSPRKVLDQSDVTSSPRKVLDQLGATSSPRKVWGQRSFKSSSYHHLPSLSSSRSVCHRLKSSLMDTFKAASESLPSQNKNKTVSLKNKNISKTSAGKEMGKRAVADDDIKLAMNMPDRLTFSSLESVAPNKVQDKNVLERKMLTGNSKNGQDGVHVVESPSVQKKKAKIAPLSAMQSSLDKTGAQSTFLSRSAKLKQFPSRPNSRQCSTRTTSHRENQEKKLTEDFETVKPAPEKFAETISIMCTTNKSDLPMTAEKYEMPQPVIDLFVPVLKFSKFFNVEQKMCAPTHDQPWHFSSPDGLSAILNNKSISGTPRGDVPSKENSSVTNIHSEEHSCKESICNILKEESNTCSVEKPQLELDLDNIRSMQLTSLKCNSKKKCTDVDNEAVVHSLWQLLESKAEDFDQQESNVAGSERMNLLGNILDKAKFNLECLELLNSQVGEDFTEASPLKETAQQHLPTTGFHIPEHGEEENNLYSEKLERALRESEHLLAELSLLTGDNMHSS